MRTNADDERETRNMLRYEDLIKQSDRDVDTVMFDLQVAMEVKKELDILERERATRERAERIAARRSVTRHSTTGNSGGA